MSLSDSALLEFFGEDARELLGSFEVDAVPAHVAIIMDGNGRWAEARRLPRVAGHRAGAKAVREAIVTAIELGVQYLTLYSFSSENWRRPKDEVSALMRLFVEVLQQELANLERQGVRLQLIGRRDRMPVDVLKAFEAAETRTAENSRLTLLIALDYGGRQELVDAVSSIAASVAVGDTDPGAIDESVLAAHLYTVGVPDPDLVIRTSGEFRVSNFLLWQVAYSELWVTDTLWPDFGRTQLLSAIVEYQGRQRRYGA